MGGGSGGGEWFHGTDYSSWDNAKSWMPSESCMCFTVGHANREQFVDVRVHAFSSLCIVTVITNRCSNAMIALIALYFAARDEWPDMWDKGFTADVSTFFSLHTERKVHRGGEKESKREWGDGGREVDDNCTTREAFARTSQRNSEWGCRNSNNRVR